MLTVVAGVAGLVITIALARAAHRAGAAGHARLLGARSPWRVPGRARGWLVRGLTDASIDVEPEAACELWFAGVGAIAIVTVAVAPGLVLVAITVGMIAGPVALKMAGDRARLRFVSSLPGTLEQVAAAMRGGASVREALGAASAGGGPVAPDLRRVCARATLGVGLVEALTAWPRERPLPAVRVAAGGLAVAAGVGGAAADAIDGLARSLRERLGAVAEARSLSAQARLSAIVVGAAPAVYLVLSAVADPTTIDTLVGTSTGRVCLFVGLALEVLAIFCIRRIVRAGAPE